jgi:hypothetical protein
MSKRDRFVASIKRVSGVIDKLGSVESYRMWCTPETMADFQAADFTDLPPAKQISLKKCNAGFLDLVGKITTTVPADADDIKNAAGFIRIIARIVAPQVAEPKGLGQESSVVITQVGVQ